MRQRDLVAALDCVPDFPAPDAGLEQYRTPSQVAAPFLLEAQQDGCLSGRDVLDLGCGTGTLSLAAHLLGARVHGVDADAGAIEVARAAVPAATFEVAELASWSPPDVDTAIMNPPFGSQRKHADRVFHERAIQATAARRGSVWFLQQPINERFLAAFYKERGLEVERIGLWDYPLGVRFDFHTDTVRGIQVGGYVATR